MLVSAHAGETAPAALDEVVVIARRLNEARNGIQTQTGASIYTINEASIGAQPGGDNQLLNQVIMQAPDVDLKTKSGVIDPGGSISIYGGSHGTVEPSFNYGGSAGRLNYFVSGDFMRNARGIESPDGRSSPTHDHTAQHHEFGYLEYLIDESNRWSAVLSSSTGKFQIPNRAGRMPGITNAAGAPLDVGGQTTYPSAALDENQRELNHFAIVSWQHSQGALDVQTSATARYSSYPATLTARFDVINVADKRYEIRDGSGVGVGAPQFGPRRGLFFGLSKSI